MKVYLLVNDWGPYDGGIDIKEISLKRETLEELAEEDSSLTIEEYEMI